METPYLRLDPCKTYYFRGNYGDGTYLVKYAKGRVILFMQVRYLRADPFREVVRFSNSWKLHELEKLVNLSTYDDSRWFLVEHKKAQAILREHGVSAADANDERVI